MAKQSKLIRSITIKRVHDDDADTSYLGTFDNSAQTEFAINHRERIKTDDRVYEWFNPQTVEPFDPKADWIPVDVTDKRTYWRDAMKKNAEADYARMVSYNNEEWHYIGIVAEAELEICGTIQTLSSAGLWGTESDSDEDYLKSIESEELGQLREILTGAGFSKRAISTAIKSI